MKLNSFVWGMVLFTIVLAVAGSAYAQTFNYNPGDLMVCFRNAGSANDLVVDAGPVSTFVNLPIGQHITITQFTGSQLAAVGTNNSKWSAFATDFAISTPKDIWVTKPRSDFNTQTTPWAAENTFAQGPTAGKMDPVGEDAITIGSGLPAGANNTATALVESESGHQVQDNGCYAFYVATLQNGGSIGNFRDTFQGNVEQATAANFTTSAQNVRADFYQLLATNTLGQGTYLGYFEFSTNGVMTYTAGPSSTTIAKPVITAFTRLLTTNTVTFTTGSSGTYSLRGTNSAGLLAPLATWPVISSVAGNGSPQSLVDINTNAQQFYIISAQ
jgi:hypothetical protein